MSRSQVEMVKCDGCLVQERVAASEGWTRWARDAGNADDLCPSCTFAIRAFLFDRKRIDVVVVNDGHPEERAAYERSKAAG